MTAYLIAKIEITDWEQYQEYMKVTPGIIAQFGGRFLSRGGEKVTLEGPEENRRVVLLEFPSLEQAQAFYHSPEYEAAKQIRARAATAQFIAIDGVN